MVITGAAWAISESAAASTASRSLVACWQRIAAASDLHSRLLT